MLSKGPYTGILSQGSFSSASTGSWYKTLVHVLPGYPHTEILHRCFEGFLIQRSCNSAGKGSSYRTLYQCFPMILLQGSCTGAFNLSLSADPDKRISYEWFHGILIQGYCTILPFTGSWHTTTPFNFDKLLPKPLANQWATYMHSGTSTWRLWVGAQELDRKDTQGKSWCDIRLTSSPYHSNLDPTWVQHWPNDLKITPDLSTGPPN